MKLALLGSLVAPAAGMLLALITPGGRAVARLSALCALLLLALAAVLASGTASGGSVSWPAAMLHVDELSALLLLLAAVLVVVAACEPPSFAPDGAGPAASGPGSRKRRRHHVRLQGLALAAATALLTDHPFVLCLAAFMAVVAAAHLVAGGRPPGAAEAGLTLLLAGALGAAVATVGTALLAAAAGGGTTFPLAASRLTGLTSAASDLDPWLARAAFPLLLFGFGTLAGLGPLHVWLPGVMRAHEAAVAALCSGILVNIGLYAILRFRVIVALALGHDLPGQMLEALGLLSAALALILLPGAGDLRRRLACTSVGQMGIVAAGLALGGAAAVGALLMMVGHTLAKTLVLLAAAPTVATSTGVHEERSAGPGGTLAAALAAAGALALAGLPPSPIFTGQYLVAMTGLAHGHGKAIALLLACGAGCAVALVAPFAGRLPGRSPAPRGAGSGPPRRVALLAALAFLLIVLGVPVPTLFSALLRGAAAASQPLAEPPLLPTPRRGAPLTQPHPRMLPGAAEPER